MKTTFQTISSAVNYFKCELVDFYDESELEQLLFITFYHYLGVNRIELTLKEDAQISKVDFDCIINTINELKTNKPLAQIIGEWEFYDLTLKVNEHTLIPRPETEELVQLIINENKEFEELSILDIGTGTGCIALSLKKNLPCSMVYGYDISDEAIKIATSNACMNKLEVTFKKVDILQPQNISDKFNVIVSNPPYICHQEKSLMKSNVLDFEPHLALFVDDKDPLIFYEAIAQYAITHLKENGKLYFEINENYGEDVVKLLKQKNFTNIKLIRDINNRDRIVKCEII